MFETSAPPQCCFRYREERGGRRSILAVTPDSATAGLHNYQTFPNRGHASRIAGRWRNSELAVATLCLSECTFEAANSSAAV